MGIVMSRRLLGLGRDLPIGSPDDVVGADRTSPGHYPDR